MEHSIPVSQTVSAPLVHGVFAAMTLARTPYGALNLDVFSAHLEFLLQKGLKGFALNGATGEYCLTTPAELATMLARARRIAGPEITLLAGVGGASVARSHELVAVAQDGGADGLLLPMPYFFPYQQQDLEAFVVEVVDRTKLPVLLYNLPSFTTALEPRTSLKLIEDCRQVKGIKDSSGQLDTLRLLRSKAPSANRVIGNDSALYDALTEELCDGVVSGVACVLPELMQALYQAVNDDALSSDGARHRAALDEFIGWLGWFPVPWGLKIVAEERGLGEADFPIPLSPERQAKRREFALWFRANRSVLLADAMPAASRIGQ